MDVGLEMGVAKVGSRRDQREATLLSIVVDRRRLLSKYHHCSGVWFCLTSSQLTLFTVLTAWQHISQLSWKLWTSLWKPHIVIIPLLSEECSYLWLFSSVFIVSVSSKPKEPGAAVVASGRSSAQPPVWQGVQCRRRRSGAEVRGEEAFSLHLFISLRTWTPNGTVKSNTGLFLPGGRKKKTKSRRGTETTHFYTRSCVSLISKKMPWCSEILLPGQCSYFDKRCGVVVVYSTLFLSNFLHFQHLSISNDLHRPWECLIQCILPEWVFWKDFFDRKD